MDEGLSLTALRARIVRACGVEGCPGLPAAAQLELLSGLLQRATRKEWPAMLTVWAAQAAGQPTALTLDAAAAWFALYLCARILDDLQDGDSLLLGPEVPTAQALNLAVGLLFAAQRCLSEGQDGVRERLRMLLLSAQVGLCAVAAQVAPAAGLEGAWAVARAKGGGPYGLAARLGAISVGAESAVEEGLAAFGAALGEALQAIDDALGVLHREAADLAPGNCSLAVAYGLAVAEGAEREALVDGLARHRQGEGEVAEEVFGLLETLGAPEYLGVAAQSALQRALAALAPISEQLRSEGRERLLQQVRSLITLPAGCPPAPGRPGGGSASG